ncbi:MAG TPA: hypothetical protein VGH73_20520 [Thermoanaerobaculia bacterium]|jgi:hypothetical protein
MKTNRPTPSAFQYTETEIRSFLPTGWDLIGDRQGWDAKKKAWRATVIDNVDFDWPVEVTADQVGKLGRLEALRRAMDKVYRERLG